jgi:hypothetical protein
MLVAQARHVAGLSLSSTRAEPEGTPKTSTLRHLPKVFGEALRRTLRFILR